MQLRNRNFATYDIRGHYEFRRHCSHNPLVVGSSPTWPTVSLSIPQRPAKPFCRRFGAQRIPVLPKLVSPERAGGLIPPPLVSQEKTWAGCACDSVAVDHRTAPPAPQAGPSGSGPSVEKASPARRRGSGETPLLPG